MTTVTAVTAFCTKDPKLIADLVKSGNYGVPYLPEDVYAELRVLCTLRDQLMEDRVRNMNRLHREMKIVFPEYREASGKNLNYICTHRTNGRYISCFENWLGQLLPAGRYENAVGRHGRMDAATYPDGVLEKVEAGANAVQESPEAGGQYKKRRDSRQHKAKASMARRKRQALRAA